MIVSRPEACIIPSNELPPGALRGEYLNPEHTARFLVWASSEAANWHREVNPAFGESEAPLSLSSFI